MLKKYKNFLCVILIIILCFCFLYLMGYFPIFRAIYQPPTMHQFYGNIISSNGNLIEKKLIISVMVNQTLCKTYTTNNGKYGYEPLFIIQDVLNGQTIEFYIDSGEKKIKVIECEFENFGLTNLDLIFDEDDENEDGRSDGGGDSGEGSSGGGSISKSINLQQEKEVLQDQDNITESDNKVSENSIKTKDSKITGRFLEQGLEKSKLFTFLIIFITIVIIILLIILYKQKQNKHDESNKNN